MELSRDKVKEIINDDWLLMDDCEGNKNCDVVKELARIALASLEAEAAITVGDDGGDALAYRRLIQTFAPGTKLYTAPPAPVSVPAAMEIDDDFDSAFEHGKAVGWNAYRAAMLQAEPVSNSDELPLDYLQGHKDGLEWAAQLAEANHPQTGDWLYDDPIDLARAIRKGPDMPTVQGGNSPVIGIDLASGPDRTVEVRYVAPPGYVMVPKEPTEAMINAWLSEVANWRGHVAGYKAALAAAPQQEVRP